MENKNHHLSAALVSLLGLGNALLVRAADHTTITNRIDADRRRRNSRRGQARSVSKTVLILASR